MTPPDRSRFRTVELGLAGLVVLVVAMELTAFPRPYPTWPAVAGVPVDPELVVPGLLGVVAVLGALRDGFSVGSVAVGVLGALTALMAATSLHQLYGDTCGCLFAGGFFTLVLGSVLAGAVVARSVLRRLGVRGVTPRLRDRLDRY